jgi:hypothetical protein
VLWSCLKLDTWEFAQACTGSVTTLKGPLVDRGFPLVERLEENTVALVGFLECLVPPHRSNGDVAPLGVNFGIHRRLLVHRLLLNPSSFTYALYIVISIMLDAIPILLSPCCSSC